MTVYLDSLTFSRGRLVVNLGNQNGRKEVVQFDFVRSFLLFKEGDFFPELQTQEKRRIKREDELSSYLYEVLSGALGASTSNDWYEDDKPQRYVLWTPDECIEVGAYEEPTLSVTAIEAEN